MEQSPNQMPNAALEVTEKYNRSVWWKVYFFFITTFFALALVNLVLDEAAGLPDYALLLFWPVVNIGFFGYVFVTPILKPSIWLPVLIIYVLYNCVYYFITDVDFAVGIDRLDYYVSTVLGWAITLPVYYALYKYSKESYPAWEARNKPGL